MTPGIAADIRAALKLRYPPPEFALMWEVASDVGGGRSRYADALAMNLYPSRGLELHGFEIKVSRHDWTRERRNPDKAEPIAQYCNRWWIVAPQKIVPRDELPPTWGLIEFDGKVLKQAVAAPSLPAKDLTRAFIAAVLRRGTAIDNAMVNSLVHAQMTERIASNEQEIEDRVTERTRSLEAKATRLKKIEEAAGISLDEKGFEFADASEIGRAIKFVMKLGVTGTYSIGRRLHRDLAGLTERLGESIAEVDKIAPPPTEEQAEEERLRFIKKKRRR